MKEKSKIFTQGIVKNNPVFIMLLGLCPTLAVSSSLKNALGMGFAVTFVLICSNVIISLNRKVIPENIRIPAYITIIATFVTIVELAMKAYFPVLSQTLGIFIPLIVVNCIILGRAEAFASKNTLLDSMLDGVGSGIGFTLALLLIAFCRELLGNGSLWGIPVSKSFKPMLVFILPAGAFFTLGTLLFFFNTVREKRKS